MRATKSVSQLTSMQDADLAARMDVGVHEAVLGLAVLLLGRVGEALLAQVLDGALEVALRGLERRLAVHDSRPGALPELLHEFG